MAQFVHVPLARLDADTLQALLGEFASRDGTDYGEQEFTLAQKISQLQHQLNAGQLMIVYDSDSHEWDLVDNDIAHVLLTE